jgi:hypothetical protein
MHQSAVETASPVISRALWSLEEKASGDLSAFRVVDDREGEFLRSVDAAIRDDGDEWHSLVEEIVHRLQGFFSRIFDDFYDPFRLARLGLHNEQLPLLLLQRSLEQVSLTRLQFRQRKSGWH